jgi:ABC-2 type transport system permease protein
VNWRHFYAFVWLRWRLLVNQWKRAGKVSAVLLGILTVAAVLTVIPLFIGSIVLGLYAIPKAEPAHLMYAWDVLIIVFLSFWAIGLVTELQRTEPRSLSKFLHLPVSVNSAFLINYLSSLVRLSLIIFGPVMLGFCLALVWTKGILFLAVLPALAAFLVMVTALTYQLQGWLASLMSNPRRRRTVVVATTMTLVLLFQLPNVLNFIRPWNLGNPTDRNNTAKEELAALERSLKAGELDARDFPTRVKEVTERQKIAIEQADHGLEERIERMVRLGNTILPIGWLPLGVATAAQGQFIPLFMGMLGMTLIATASLWRAYRTTVGIYQGQFSRKKRRQARPVASTPGASTPTAGLLEMRLPGCSEPVAAVATAGFRSLMRAPEAKMMLLTPVIMVPIFGSMLWRSRASIPESMRPLIALAGMVLVLFGVIQLMANQFAFDRDGFRVFVLSAASRRDILLGKNMAFAPVALGLGLIVLAIVQFACPLRPDHFVAMVPLYVSMFLLFCVFTNLMSIITPLPVAAGSLKPSSPSFKTVLIQMLMFLVFFPLTQAPVMLPLGVESAMRFLGYGAGIPICLLLSLAELVVVAVVYYFCLMLLGDLMQAREQKILEVVTNRANA